MISLADLLTVPSKDEVLNSLIAVARLANFPTASWQAASVPRTMFECEASWLATLSSMVRSVAESGFRSVAAGAWLDLLGEDFYDEARIQAVSTTGLVVLLDAARQGPFVVPAGSWWVANASKDKRYTNAAGFTLDVGGSAIVSFVAETPGSTWNLPSFAIVDVLSPGGTGVTVTNPADRTGSWIRTQGADAEHDADYRERLRQKWHELGSGSTRAAYEYVAKTASAEVRRVLVSTYWAPEGRGIRIVVAGDSGPVSSTALSTVGDVIAECMPLGLDLDVLNATGRTFPVTVSLFISTTALRSDVEGKVAQAIGDYLGGLAIGAVVYRSALIGRCMIAGVVNALVSVPEADVALGPLEVAMPVVSYV